MNANCHNCGRPFNTRDGGTACGTCREVFCPECKEHCVPDSFFLDKLPTCYECLAREVVEDINDDQTSRTVAVPKTSTEACSVLPRPL